MIKALIISMRPKQWVKNLFVVLPLIFSKQVFNVRISLRVFIGFLLFSFASGMVYLINDILDRKEDMVHPEKRKRPIASGTFTVKSAILSAFFIGFLTLVFSFLLEPAFGVIILTYLVFNMLYSKILKEAVIIDVFCIGGFFLLRVITGGVLTGMGVSHWIVAMTALLALFLGFNKRRQELQIYAEHAKEQRGVLSKYSKYFIDQMISVITSSIVVVYMLYTVDTRTVNVFGTNHLIYTIPFVYYGIFRYLYLIHKHGEDGDPTAILFKDKKMQLNIVLWVTVCIAVIYFGL